MNIEMKASLIKTINTLDLFEAKEILESNYKYTLGKTRRPSLSPIGMFLLLSCFYGWNPIVITTY